MARCRSLARDVVLVEFGCTVFAYIYPMAMFKKAAKSGKGMSVLEISHNMVEGGDDSIDRGGGAGTLYRRLSGRLRRWAGRITCD